MDALDKDVSSSRFVKPPQMPRVSASDENDQSHQGMGFNIQNPKKSTPKHYMSPTISAAGKTVVPRKKILGERNEALEPIFSDAHVQESPILESKVTHVTPGTGISDVTSTQDFVSDNNEQNALVDDGSLRPYDPLTNYLSPRPKFLRYNPGRRREIFLRREKENSEGNDGLNVCTNGSFEIRQASNEESSLASPQEVSVMQEDEETEDIDEELEEVEEERGWSLKRVLESFYWFAILVLSIFYVSSMILPESSSSSQALEVLERGYCRIQNSTLEAFLDLRPEGVRGIWDQRQEIAMVWDQVPQRPTGEGVEEEEMVEGIKMGGGEIAELNKVARLESGESGALEVFEDEKKGAVNELGEVVEPQAEDIEDDCDLATVKTREFEDEKKGAFNELDEVVEPQTEDIEDDCDRATVKTRDVSSQMTENSESQIAVTLQEFEAFQDYHAPSTLGHHVIQSDFANVLEEENDVLMEPAEENYNKNAGDEAAETKIEGIDNVAVKTGEVLSTERMVDGDTGFEILDLNSERMVDGDTDFEVLDLDSEVDLEEEGLTKYLEAKSFLKAVIGVCLFYIISASLVSGFRIKRKKTSGTDSSRLSKLRSTSLITKQEKTSRNGSSLIKKPSSESSKIVQNKTLTEDSLIAKPCIESVTAEKHCPVLPRIESGAIEGVKTFRNHSTLHPITESSQGCNESRAPTIELLGEFAVGDISSSLRSCGMKNRRMEILDSNYSRSTEKSGSKAYAVPVQSQSAFSESSTMDSHSYGNFSADKKIVKKQDGKDGEATVTPTPVRRSSRIRNRSVTSP